MTDVSRNNTTLISTPDEARALYRGNGLPGEKQKIGLETEIFIYRDGPAAPVAATARECAQLVESLKARGESAQLEMTSAVEYASPPVEHAKAGQLAREIGRALGVYREEILAAGLKPHDGAILPFATLQSAEENLVDRDRARGLVRGMKALKPEAFLKVTLLCTSTQVSLSYKDADDLHDIAATAYALTPAIFGLFANHPDTMEDGKPVTGQPRAQLYGDFGREGGIAESFLAAKDGGDFVKRHTEQVFETPMLYYYGAKQEIVWPDRPVTFADLKAEGLNTRSNYDLAESFIYHDLKICNIRDERGEPVGKRIEVRGFDAGETGALAAAPFLQAALRDDAARWEVKGLLEDYGMAPGIHGFEARLKAARHNAAHHGGRFLDVPFGTRPDGKDGSLKAFCHDLGVVLQRHILRNPEVAPFLKPVIEICKSGVPQAAVPRPAAGTDCAPAMQYG